MIGERTIDGLPAQTLRSDEADLEAAFVPAAGMVGCSLRHRGEELLGQRGGLRAYVAERSTMGIPLLYPWANRLSRKRFSLQGREVVLDSPSTPVSLDPNGLPIHGLLAGASGWRVLRHEPSKDGGTLAAGFDFGSHAELMAAFPFAHQLGIEIALDGSRLTIATTVMAVGEVPVPVSFGYHPYFRLPGVDRRDWEVTIPVSERVVLDSKGLPTGRLEKAEVPGGPLGARTFDDGFAAAEDSAPFVLAGGPRIEVSFTSGYPFAQVYAPADNDVIAFEPMTAPTNALVTGGPDLPVLEPGEEYTAAFSVTVS